MFILVGDEMDAEREFIDAGTLAAEVEDADFGVGHTAVETGLWVRLQSENVSGFVHATAVV